MPEEKVDDELYGLLTEWIARHGTCPQKVEIGHPNAFRRMEIWHHGMPCLGRAIAILRQLKILRPSKKQAFCFQFACHRDKLAEVAVRNRGKGPQREEVLACFLEAAHTYQGLELRVGKWFPVQPDRKRLFDLLALTGYAKRQGEFCCWTPEIDPVVSDTYIFFDRRGRAARTGKQAEAFR